MTCVLQVRSGRFSLQEWSALMIYWFSRGATSLVALVALVVWHITAASSAAQSPERHGEAKPAPGGSVIVPANNAALTPAAPTEKDASNDGPEVAVEIRIIGISEEMAKRLGVRYGINCFKCKKPDDTSETPHVSLLNDLQVFKLMEIIQGDARANVMQAPKLTLVNGQSGSLEVLDYQWFVTDIQAVTAGQVAFVPKTDIQAVQNAGQVVFVPKNERIPLGLQAAVRPLISSDQKSVQLKLNLTQTSLASATVPLFPVTNFITPVFEGGAQGQPVPFTQFIQQPTVSTWKVDLTMNIPDKGTALLSGWKVLRERTTDWDKVAGVFKQVPVVKQLIGAAPVRTEPEYLMVMVSPRIDTETTASNTPKAPVAPPAPPIVQKPTDEAASRLVSKSNNAVARLLAEYQRACQEGRFAEAKELAAKALTLDPTCFSNR